MKRPLSVTIAAGIAFAGSACIALLGLLGLVVLLTLIGGGKLSNPVAKQGPLPMGAAMSIGLLFEFALAGWGLATAIGLLLLKPWSRISILIFAGLMAVISAFSALVFLLVPLPQSQGVPGNFILRLVMESFYLILIAIAAWWLILFTRKSVTTQFASTPIALSVPHEPIPIPLAAPQAIPQQPGRPLPITLIAWLYLVSVPMMIPSLLINRLQNMPLPFLGYMLEGWAVWIYLILSALIALVTGVALLKNKPWGLWLAFGLQSFGILNFAAIVLLPGRTARWQKYMGYFGHSLPPELAGQLSSFLAVITVMSLGVGTLFSIFILYLLWTRRHRFFNLAALQSDSVRWHT